MSFYALALLLVAACIHATWNLFLKRVEGGVAFQWLFAALSTAIYFPAVLFLCWYQPPHLDGTMMAMVVGSSVLHSLYYFVLQQGYRVGDLSLVYPVARGTGPLLATVGGILLLGERPPPVALAGGALTVMGVFVITGGAVWSRDNRQSRLAVKYGLATGIVIAGYTLWDKLAVSSLLLAPLLLDWGTNCGRSILLAPLAWHRRYEVRRAWHRYRKEAVAIALMNPLAYLLVLTALQFTPVSYIAPAREMSILIGSLMGVHLLGEGEARRRLFGAACMVLGIVALMWR